ncbi:hypothetical protein [Kineosporia babensis]|uniref:Uncharacterized protein n=1 Tax=Kineosporia babensis TaxID=499548 RepID=A0A9X1NG97_9ACTN|nr:hypothetical protein [Kineosporia babensis]MCD5312756.1 hypothetical protein [Kineosporia babensis]
MGNWPVVVTNRCADACAAQFQLGSRAEARDWLESEIVLEGRITDRLPPEAAGLHSRTGWFLVFDDLLVLSLGNDWLGRQVWVATNCFAWPKGPEPPHSSFFRRLRGRRP